MGYNENKKSGHYRFGHYFSYLVSKNLKVVGRYTVLWYSVSFNQAKPIHGFRYWISTTFFNRITSRSDDSEYPWGILVKVPVNT